MTLVTFARIPFIIGRKTAPRTERYAAANAERHDASLQGEIDAWRHETGPPSA